MSPEYWRSSEGRKAAAALVGLLMTGGVAACGDDGDGGEADRADEATTAPDRLPATIGGADVLKDGPDRDEPIPGYQELVGTLQGSDIYVAIVSAEGRRDTAIAYLCDGAAVAEVLSGPSGPEIELELESAKGSTLTATLDDSGASGTVTLSDGREFPFEATAVDPEGEAGLYFSDSDVDESFTGDDYGGWIVLPDGSQRGGFNRAGMVAPGGQLDPGAGTVAVGTATIQAGAVRPFVLPWDF